MPKLVQVGAGHRPARIIDAKPAKIVDARQITAIIQDLEIPEIVAAASCWFCQSKAVISKTLNDQNLTIEHFENIQ